MDLKAFGLVGVGAITVIYYLGGLAVKAARLDSRLIPVFCGTLGLVLGLACYFCRLGILPAGDPVTAAAVGIVSGLAATGADQVKKQLLKDSQL